MDRYAYICSMVKDFLFTLLFLFPVAASAQFHTVSHRPVLYRIELPTDGTAHMGKVENETVPEPVKADTVNLRKKWIGQYMSVSYPLKEVHVTSPFGVRTDPFTKKKKKHNGLDLRAKHCETYAMMQGIVLKVGQDKSSGKYVTVRHGDFTVSYCHLSKIMVQRGVAVLPGQVIAITGNTGRSTSPHLHLTVRHRSKLVNPQLLLNYIHNIKNEAYSHLYLI